MSSGTEPRVSSAEIVLGSPDLDAALAFFTDLGFVIDRISPADDPRVAVVAGFGVRLRLDRDAAAAPTVLRLVCADPASIADGRDTVTAPDGAVVELVADSPTPIPDLRPELVVNRISDGAPWSVGRAGMRYRDLIPGRQGGRFIASHIQIPDGGPVPDWVHFHDIRFQMIYCHQGWVRVVYEDQGPSFVLNAGDCVLQPPLIRHRVLESSPGLEVIELACPATHDTYADHDLELPTSEVQPDRDFSGQRVVRHRCDAATWEPSRFAGFEWRDLGMADATDGLAGAAVLRVAGTAQPLTIRHDAELMFVFVLAGRARLTDRSHDEWSLTGGDCFAVPGGDEHTLTDCSDDLELLEVVLPAPS